MPSTALAAARDRYWNGLLRLHPLLSTLVGDDRYDDELPDLSVEGLTEAERIHRASLDALARLDDGALDEDDRLDAAVMRAIASRELEALALHLYRLDVSSHMGDAWTVCPGTLLSQLSTLQHPTTPEAESRYLARLERIPRYLDQAGVVLRASVQEGPAPSLAVLERTLGQVSTILGTPAQASPALDALEESSPARQQAVELLQREVVPAYRRFHSELQDARSRARTTFGLSGLKDGVALYAAYIRYWLSVPLSGDQLHARGLGDLGDVLRERTDAARELGFPSPEAAAAEYLATGRGPKSRDDLLARTRELVERSWDASTRLFQRLPAANCEVELVEKSREADYLAYYQPASRDGSRPATYYVSGAELDSRPMHRLAAWTYHEANPGHHFQIALEQQAATRSPLRRFTNDFASSTFVEGWGLYAERLADEMGLYADDFERLGMLDQQAFRCARLVVDTGIHALGWTRDRAVEVLAGSGIPRSEATIEADRYAAVPGQALTYRIGQLAITRWRDELTSPEGGRDVRHFHDRLLSLGSLPLTALARELRVSASEWV
jgi:uncharacterized protein (DUF885 family)